jgi:ABC-2 type transport system ATP-binding protein
MSDVAFSLRRATVLRNEQRLLDGVDLTVERGEVVVITGDNGAGKTTLLRVLSGLARLTAGEGEVLGEPLPLSAATRRRVRAALDEPAFWPWMTAHGVLRTVADLSGEPRPDIGSVLSEVGLDSSRFALRRTKRVGHFSQGMRKRLQVACVLALSGDLLLVDEPTASVDEPGAELVWDALRRRAQSGVTIVVATHERDAAARLDARAAHLDRGRLSAT